MSIAHLPSGYLVSRLHPALKLHRWWVMAGSVLPDLDMLYFHLVDAGRVHHHSYLTHRPALWLVVLLCGVVLLAPRLRALGIGGLLHMSLDSMAGAIGWGWPVWDVAFPLVIVPATHDWWVMSFLLHWTFGFEVLICGLAACLYSQEVRDTRPLRGSP